MFKWQKVIDLLKKPLLYAAVFLLAANVSADVLTVTSNADSGAGSLRQTIADAVSGDTIIFDSTLEGSVITLTSGELIITNKTLSIVGPEPVLLSISGNNSSRIFSVFPGADHIDFSISGVSLVDGNSNDNGGAIRTTTSWNTRRVYLTLSNCVFRANSTSNEGGAVYAARETYLNTFDCEFIENESVYNGGAVWLYSDSNIERSTFVSNITLRTGGGLHVRHQGVVQVRNSTFSGNQAGEALEGHHDGGGAGIGTQEKTHLAIYNSTITGNHLTTSSADKQVGAGVYGRGIENDSHYIRLYSTIVAGNTAGNDYPDIGGYFTSFTNCLIKVTNDVTIVGANNIFDQDALLAELADNGGLTRTHALSPNSPAIDAGNNPLGLQTDQRGTGFPRESGEGVDIGAFELSSSPAGTVLIIK